MNFIDVILALILLVGIITGFRKGFIYEIAILSCIFFCYLFGFKAAAFASGYIEKMIEVNPVTLYYISLFVAWIGISIGIFFLSRLLEGLIKIAALGPFNKIAGAVFGMCKYGILLSLFLFFFNKVNIPVSWLNADSKAESKLYYPLLKVSTSIFSLIKK